MNWKVLTRIYAGIWALAGFSLMYKGIHMWMQFLKGVPANLSLLWLDSLTAYIGIHATVTFSMVLALYLGHIKGRGVLAKAMEKMIHRFQLPADQRSYKSYLGFFVLIACMIAIGQVMKMPFMPKDLYALVDLAVGSALFQASLKGFRMLQVTEYKKA